MEHTIERGDTLSQIAQTHGTTVAELQKVNPSIDNPDRICAGATLNLPCNTHGTHNHGSDNDAGAGGAGRDSASSFNSRDLTFMPQIKASCDFSIGTDLTDPLASTLSTSCTSGGASMYTETGVSTDFKGNVTTEACLVFDKPDGSKTKLCVGQQLDEGMTPLGRQCLSFKTEVPLPQMDGSMDQHVLLDPGKPLDLDFGFISVKSKVEVGDTLVKSSQEVCADLTSTSAALAAAAVFAPTMAGLEAQAALLALQASLASQ
jgi:hypothetical protein